MAPDLESRLRSYREDLDAGAPQVTSDEVMARASTGDSAKPVATHRQRPAGWLIAVASASAVFLLVGVAILLVPGSEPSPGYRAPPEPVTTIAAPIETPTPEESALPPGPSVQFIESGNLSLVGESLDAVTDAPLAGVAIHNDIAYVGGMSVGYRTQVNIGIRLVDVSDPENPQLVGKIPLRSDGYGISDHAHGDAVATTVNSEAFSGVVAVVLYGVPDSYGTNDYPQPYGIWDVTDPAQPEFLSIIDIGKSSLGNEGGDLGDKPYDSKAIAGHHFFALYDRDTGENSLRNENSDIWMAVVDVSDPRNPTVVADWQEDREVWLVGLALNESGTRAFLTGITPRPTPGGHNAEEGVLYILDITEPTQPSLLGSYRFPLLGTPSSMSKAIPTTDGSHVLLLDHSWEESAPGIVHVLDITDLDDIREVATWHPKESTPVAGPEGKRYWSIASDVVIRGDTAFVAWLRDGVFALDISDPANPVEVGHFFFPAKYDVPISDVAFYGGNYVLATTVWYEGMYVLKITDEQSTSE